MSPRARGKRANRHVQTLAVSRGRRGVRLAPIRLTVKLLLWSAFFSGLFTVHAHLGLRTSLLQAETYRLEQEVDQLRNQHRSLESRLSEMRDVSDLSARAAVQFPQMAEVTPRRTLHVDSELRTEVAQDAIIWSRPDSWGTAGGEGVIEWLDALAGLCTGLEIPGSEGGYS